MRWVLAALTLTIGLALALTGSCSFRTVPGSPSDGTPTGDGSAATDGPAGDARSPDAPPGLICNPTACGLAGGSCTADNHCRIQNSGASAVTCPAGHFCDILCTGSNGCRQGGVECGTAAGCNVTCGGGGPTDQACQAGVHCPAIGPCTVTCNGGQTCQREAIVCGVGPCDVQCLGTDACSDKGVDCRLSPQCNVKCVGANACRNGGIACGPGTCNGTCNGSAACENFPNTCDVAPTQCAFHCCGANACMNPSRCAGCSRDAVCM